MPDTDCSHPRPTGVPHRCIGSRSCRLQSNSPRNEACSPIRPNHSAHSLPVTNKVSLQRWIALHCTVASIPLVLRRVASPVTVSVSYPTRHASPYTVASVPLQLCSVARLITNAILKPKVQAPRFTIPSIPLVLRIVAWRITIIVFNLRRKTYWLAFISVLVRLADWPAVASVKLSFFNVAGRIARAVSDPVRWQGGIQSPPSKLFSGGTAVWVARAIALLRRVAVGVDSQLAAQGQVEAHTQQHAFHTI